MNQDPRLVRLVEKSRGQKSPATVPLNVMLNNPDYYKANWAFYLTTH